MCKVFEVDVPARLFDLGMILGDEVYVDRDNIPHLCRVLTRCFDDNTLAKLKERITVLVLSTGGNDRFAPFRIHLVSRGRLSGNPWLGDIAQILVSNFPESLLLPAVCSD